MRVLYDHQAFSLQDYGGVSRYVWELMRHADADVQCELAVTLSNNLYLRDWSPSPVSTFLPGWPIRGRWRVIKLANMHASKAALRRGRFDVFHPTLTDDEYFLDLLGDKPYVVTLHDLIPQLYPEYYAAWPLEAIQRVAQGAARVIAVSENTRADALRLLSLDPERVVTVPHGTTVTAPTGPAPAVPAQYVLYTGMRSTYKNFGCLLAAMALLRAAHPSLHLVCAGGGAFTGEERQRLHELNLHDRVLQLGPLSDGQLAHLYRGAAVFAFPSRYEGFGLPILEAFAHSCPVVLSRASCFPEVAQDAALYFDPDQPAELAELLGQVLADRSLRRQLRTLGELRSHDFSWRRTADLTHSVYHEAREASVPACSQSIVS